MKKQDENVKLDKGARKQKMSPQPTKVLLRRAYGGY